MFKKILIGFGSLIVAIYGGLWLLNLQTFPVAYGISFSKNYASSLGLDWKKTYLDILTDLKPKYVRLGVEWNAVEPEPGKFNFTETDFLLAEAQKHEVKVLLVIGQKIPRWPECYFPNWFEKTAKKDEAILNYLTKVVERYKNNPALEIWQVENEPYISFDFGVCGSFNPDLVAQEIALVKKIDPNHKILVTDSGELSTWRKSIWASDLFGSTMYRTVVSPDGLLFYYDWLPASFYRIKLWFFNRPVSEFFVAELQAEPWFHKAGPLNTNSIESEKTMNPIRLQKHFDLVKHIGMPRAYLWGAEWWYFMKEKNGDARYWDLAKQNILGQK